MEIKRVRFALGKVLIGISTILGAETSFATLTSVTFTAAEGDRSASATFTALAGGQLQITLANSYTGDTPDQAHVLTALFFSGEGSSLTPVSAVAGAGSTYWLNNTHPTPSTLELAQQWQYVSGAGISSAGFGVFGPAGNFTSSGGQLDGSAYGLVSQGYGGSTLDGLKDRIYVQDAMVFTLSGFSGDVSSITGVRFQYGTDLKEPCLAAVPEPTTLISGALLLLPAGVSVMRTLRRK
jgi:hypothetical protein